MTCTKRMRFISASEAKAYMTRHNAKAVHDAPRYSHVHFCAEHSCYHVSTSGADGSSVLHNPRRKSRKLKTGRNNVRRFYDVDMRVQVGY